MVVKLDFLAHMNQTAISSIVITSKALDPALQCEVGVGEFATVHSGHVPTRPTTADNLGQPGGTRILLTVIGGPVVRCGKGGNSTHQ